MDLSSALAHYAKLVELVIEEHLKGEVKSLYEPMVVYPRRGGKRLRPTLCLLSCEAVGGKKEDALPTAAALEILHNAFLIHDDIMDDSVLRRGKPCLHLIYGVPLAINAGDGLLFKAYELLLKNFSSLKKEIAEEVLRRIVKMCIITTEGQAMDVGWIREGRFDISEEEFFAMVERKTGFYSGKIPCELGAVIGGGSEEEIEALGEYGRNIAIAFQIQDDILNLTVPKESAELPPAYGEQKGYGKERGGDIAEGKRTLMLIHLLRHASNEDRERIIEILSKPRAEKSENEIEEIIELMHSYGSIEYARKIARKFVGEGIKHLEKIRESEAKGILKALAQFVIEREF